VASRVLQNGAGMEIIDPEFRTLGLLVLKAAFKMPVLLRETLLFGRSRFCIPLQTVLAHTLGGKFTVQTRFTDGPMKGQNFSCLTSEAYFMLGSHRESDLQRLVLQTVKTGDIVYDIGGHVGYTALLFSALVGGKGYVFAFEPSPANYARLRGNMDANRVLNVTTVDGAASDQGGFALLEERGTQSSIASGQGAATVATSKVRTIRLDDFVYRDANPPPTFVKLDVEGHGGAVLEGMKQVLQSARPTILCELHDPGEENRATQILTSCGYRLLQVGRRKFPWRALATPLP
jgi:FkbM family methyltransferase